MFIGIQYMKNKKGRKMNVEPNIFIFLHVGFFFWDIESCCKIRTVKEKKEKMTV